MGRTTIHRNERVVFRALASDAGGVLLHLDTADYFGVNAIGARIWQLLETTDDWSGLLQHLASELEAGLPPEAAHELLVFLDALAERGLVEVRGRDGAV